MTRTSFAPIVWLLCAPALFAAEPKLIEVRKVWDAAPHNAFTDLIRFKDRWWLAFREAKEHGVSPDGSLRLLVSDDGKAWESAAKLSDARGDLRDPKLSVLPDGRLIIATVVAFVGRNADPKLRHQSLVYLSADGRQWSEPQKIGQPNDWLWRVTWHGMEGLSFGYSTTERSHVRLYRGGVNAKFDALIDDLKLPGEANEITARFMADGTALALARRDPEPALWGVARPPYKEWTWKPLDLRVGGPNFIILPDGRMIAAVRLHQPKVHTGLAWIKLDEGKLEPCLTLPSGGDTSYAGLVWHESQLWVSYYSSHEGKTSIYLARVALD